MRMRAWLVISGCSYKQLVRSKVVAKDKTPYHAFTHFLYYLTITV